MLAGRGVLVLICLSLICLPGGDLALAEEQEEKPEAAEEKKGADEEKKGANKEKKGADKEKKGADEDKGEAGEEKKGIEEEKERGYTEAVKVTAIRVETDLMKTPIAVTALDQETLDQQGVQNVRDLAQLVPNMDIATINGQSTPIIALRGVRSTNETELGDPAVGVHLDGIYSPRMQGILGLMFDNERVEVLRGPQGTLFGRNSTVGSINIISAKPQLDAFHSSLWAQYGNFNAPEIQAMINVPVSDTFALRFAGRFHQRDSYIDGYWDPNQYDQRYIGGLVDDAEVIAPGSFDECTSPECHTRTQHSNWWAEETGGGTEIRELVPADEDDFYMNAEEWAYRLSGRWQRKNKRMSLNFSFQQFRSDSAGGIDLVNCEKLRGRPNYDFEYDEDGNLLGVYQNGTNDCSDLFPKDDTYQAVVNVPGRFYLDIKYLRAEFNWDIKPNLRFVYLGGGEDRDRESAQDMEQSLNAWDQAMFFLPGTGSKSWMHEIQLQSYGNKRFNWIAGANLFHEKTSTIGYFDNTINPKSLWDQPNRSTDAYALFAQGTYSFSDKWHLTVGYRYSDETKEDKGGQTWDCTVDNDCAPQIPREDVDCNPVTGECTTGFAREDLTGVPLDYFANPANYPPGAFNANDNKGSWSHNDWRIGLDYQRENTLVYSYLATGFKAGGIGDVFQVHNPRPPGEDIIVRTSYGPEEVTTLELGIKQRLLNNKLDLRGAYFYSDYENMQYASVGAVAFTERWGAIYDPVTGEFLGFGWVASPFIAYFTQNVPGAEIQGFELEYDWHAWIGGRIWGYASWLDTEITEDWITNWNYDPVSYLGLSFEQAVDPSNPVLEVNLKGNDLAVSPPFKLHMTLEHAFVLPKRNLAITPWVTAHWEDDSYLTIWNVDKHTDDMDFVIFDEDIKYTDDRRNAWSMLHAGLRFYRGNSMMEAYGYNLTNEVVQYWGGAAEQVARGSFSTPRSYGIRFGHHF
jgi:iron complex outermembrane receptor protein